MDNADKARIALAMVTAGLAAVAITKADTYQGNAVARWVLFCALAGILMNSRQGMSQRDVFTGAVLCAFAFDFALSWIALLNQGVIPYFSGTRLDFIRNPTYASTVLAGTFVTTTFGVFVGSMARPATIDALEWAMHMDPDRVKNLERVLRAAFSVCATVAMFLL